MPRVLLLAGHDEGRKRYEQLSCVLHAELVRETRQGRWPAERTVALSLSDSVCFVFTTAEWLPGDTAWLAIPSLGTPALQAVCRRVAPWRGDALGPQTWLDHDRASPMPGIGLNFQDITPAQREALDALLSGAAAPRRGQGAQHG